MREINLPKLKAALHSTFAVTRSGITIERRLPSGNRVRSLSVDFYDVRYPDNCASLEVWTPHGALEVTNVYLFPIVLVGAEVNGMSQDMMRVIAFIHRFIELNSS